MSEQINPSEAIKELFRNLSSVILGKNDALKLTLVTLLCKGHLLIEDAPGLGKTTLAKALAQSLAMDFKRIQCTPDLMPSDITGINVYNSEEHKFHFLPGPIFTNVLLADEINRATPRSQSALLEAMAEGTVSLDRETHRLPETFLVIATQNPVEFSGTYPLPEAQLDRFFMRISLGYPGEDNEINLMKSQQNGHPLSKIGPVMSENQLQALQTHVSRIPITEELLRYIAALVGATRVHKKIRLGASPRGSLALMKASQAMALLSGKRFVTPDLIQQMAKPVLGHRILFKDASLLSPEAQSNVLDEILRQVPVPDFPMPASP